MPTNRKAARKGPQRKKSTRASSTKKKTTKSNGTKVRGGIFGRFARRISGRNLPWYWTTLRWCAFLGVSGFVALAAAFFLLYSMISIPDANADFKTQTTKVYYSDGKTQIGEFATQDREIITLEQMPASMQAAAIAAEDRSFYSNRGIDFKGIVRAFRNNTTSGQITGGGSTITQQYVKILYLNQERSYTRKIKEAILSIKVNNQLSKEEILEGYLNTIYFGNGAYGVEVAAQNYFNKAASELTVPESAFLATIINNPSYYDPYTEGASERILPRYNYVLSGMVLSGALTQAEADQFTGNLPEFAKKTTNNRFGGTKGYLLAMVKEELLARDFSEAEIEGGGLRIVTTFDKDMQSAAVSAVKEVQPEGLDEIHTALVSVEPGSGAVRALYGGPDYLKSELNWATLGTQPGSTFKAFAVIAALENGYALDTQLDGDSPLSFGKNVKIENQGYTSYGKIPLSKATEQSVNTAFADLVDQMDEGPAKTLEAANQAGIPTSVTDTYNPDVLAVPLGYEKVPPIDMANAYATIAAEGKKSNWYVVESVANFKGETQYEHKGKSEQTIPEDVSRDTIAALRQVVSSGSGSQARTICQTAGKTGTATAGEGRSTRVSSSWFVGFTPKLATAVMYNRGTGNEQLEGYLRPFFGGTYPARTFRAFMNEALDGSDCGTFPPAAKIKATKGTTWKKPPPKCGDDEELNDKKTKCVKKPEPEPEPEPEPIAPPMVDCPDGSQAADLSQCPEVTTPPEECVADPTATPPVICPATTGPPADPGTGGGSSGGAGRGR